MLRGGFGGREEEAAADYLASQSHGKAIIAYVAGRHVPATRRLGHAGTVMGFGADGAQRKIDAFLAAGIAIAQNAGMIGATMKDALKKQGK